MNKRNNILVRFTMWVVNCWRVVMDNRYNPLKHMLPKSTNVFYISLVCNVVCILWIRCKLLHGLVRL